MKLDSKYFDSIRVKPEKDLRARENAQRCEWKGCDKKAEHKAPKGRRQEGEYHHFCLAHVREYNKSYNYFSDMSEGEWKNYQDAARTGHRPTWSMADKNTGAASPRGRQAGRPKARKIADPLNLLGKDGKTHNTKKPVRRVIHKLQRKSLTALDLDVDATAEEIKLRYKELVKRHHPDANGGDRACEDKLREIIQAYNYLKGAGFC